MLWLSTLLFACDHELPPNPFDHRVELDSFYMLCTFDPLFKPVLTVLKKEIENYENSLVAQSLLNLCNTSGEFNGDSIVNYILAFGGNNKKKLQKLKQQIFKNQDYTSLYLVTVHYQLVDIDDDLLSWYAESIALNTNYGEILDKINNHALQLNPTALFYLGEYYSGNFVQRNVEKARENYQKAATLGHEKAQYRFDTLSEEKNPDEKQIVKCLWENAIEGDPEAQFHLSCAYESGTGINDDNDLALRWLFQSAKNGNYAPAQTKMGDYYFNNACYEDAAIWYLAALDQGYNAVEPMLQQCYENGADKDNIEKLYHEKFKEEEEINSPTNSQPITPEEAVSSPTISLSSQTSSPRWYQWRPWSSGSNLVSPTEKSPTTLPAITEPLSLRSSEPIITSEEIKNLEISINQKKKSMTITLGSSHSNTKELTLSATDHCSCEILCEDCTPHNTKELERLVQEKLLESITIYQEGPTEDLNTLARSALAPLVQAIIFERPVTDADLVCLTNFSALAYLSLAEAEIITDQGINNLAKLEGLTYLILHHCEQISRKGLNNLATLKNLKYLALVNCQQITPEDSARLHQELPQTYIKILSN